MVIVSTDENHLFQGLCKVIKSRQSGSFYKTTFRVIIKALYFNIS